MIDRKLSILIWNEKITNNNNKKKKKNKKVHNVHLEIFFYTKLLKKHTKILLKCQEKKKKK